MLKNKIVGVILISIFIYVSLIYISNKTFLDSIDRAVLNSATTSSRIISSLIREFRELYTKNVAKKVTMHDIKVSHEYENSMDAIPLPASLSLALGKNISVKDLGVKVDLVSPYPFPWRDKVMSEFDTRAWAAISNSNIKQYTEVGEDGLFYSATPDLMTEGCIDCHNSYENTPRSDWKLGDLRGLLTVVVDLNPIRQNTIAHVASARYFQLLLLTIIGIATTVYIFTTYRKSSLLSMSVLDAKHQLGESINKNASLRHEADKKEVILDTVLESVIDGIFTVNNRGDIQSVNSAGKRMFGYLNNELVGLPLVTIVELPENEITTLLLSCDKSDSDAGWLDAIGNKKNGYTFPLRLSITKIKTLQGANYTCVVRDITEDNRQKELIVNAQKVAEQANNAKGQFLANMSHEIRTPMNGILGTLQVIERHALSTDVKELVSTGINSASSLLTIVNDILDFSKIEEGKLLLENIPFSLKSILDIVHSDIEYSLKDKDIVFMVNYSRNYEDTWRGDPVRIKQVLLNVVANAIKFTKIGSVEINVAVQTIGEQGKLELSIVDSGIGMSEEFQQQLFTRFKQSDNSTTRKYGGTGLGLAITQKLVLLMKGEINFTSELNKGTTVDISLPLEKVKSGEVSTIQSIDRKCPDASGINILLAEDNRVNQIVFTKMLQPTNANLIIASDGLEALKAINKQQPDIIFLDIQMPNLNGVDTCIAIREKSLTLPVIAVTANIMQNDIEKYLAVGFDLCLSKPINLNELYKCLQEFLDKKTESIL